MIVRENLLEQYHVNLQKIIITYRNLYENADVDREDFLKVSIQPLNEEVARLTVNTVNELLLDEDIVFDKEFAVKVTTYSLKAVTDFVKGIKEKQ